MSSGEYCHIDRAIITGTFHPDYWARQGIRGAPVGFNSEGEIRIIQYDGHAVEVIHLHADHYLTYEEAVVAARAALQLAYQQNSYSVSTGLVAVMDPNPNPNIGVGYVVEVREKPHDPQSLQGLWGWGSL